MTHEPDAVSKPVPSHSGPMSAHLGLILHVTTNWADPAGFFSDPAHRASSTWWVSKPGVLEEFVDPDLRAWAQAAGNETYDSVETDGTPDVPLSAAQIETLAHLYAWGHGHYGWPFRLAEAPGQPGFGWHGMGGQAWGGHPFCPGEIRKGQRQAILDRAQQIVGAHAPSPVPRPPAVIRRTKAGDPWLGLQNPPLTGQAVVNVRHALHLCDPTFPEGDTYDVPTARIVQVFQAHRGIVERGVGDLTWAALRAVPGDH